VLGIGISFSQLALAKRGWREGGGGRELSLRERGSSRLLLSRACIFSRLFLLSALRSRVDIAARWSHARYRRIFPFPNLRRFSRRFIADRLIRKQRSRELQWSRRCSGERFIFSFFPAAPPAAFLLFPLKEERYYARARARSTAINSRGLRRFVLFAS